MNPRPLLIANDVELPGCFVMFEVSIFNLKHGQTYIYRAESPNIIDNTVFSKLTKTCYDGDICRECIETGEYKILCFNDFHPDLTLVMYSSYAVINRAKQGSFNFSQKIRQKYGLGNYFMVQDYFESMSSLNNTNRTDSQVTVSDSSSCYNSMRNSIKISQFGFKTLCEAICSKDSDSTLCVSFAFWVERSKSLRSEIDIFKDSIFWSIDDKTNSGEIIKRYRNLTLNRSCYDDSNNSIGERYSGCGGCDDDKELKSESLELKEVKKHVNKKYLKYDNFKMPNNITDRKAYVKQSTNFISYDTYNDFINTFIPLVTDPIIYMRNTITLLRMVRSEKVNTNRQNSGMTEPQKQHSKTAKYSLQNFDPAIIIQNIHERYFKRVYEVLKYIEDTEWDKMKCFSQDFTEKTIDEKCISLPAYKYVNYMENNVYEYENTKDSFKKLLYSGSVKERIRNVTSIVNMNKGMDITKDVKTGKINLEIYPYQTKLYRNIPYWTTQYKNSFWYNETPPERLGLSKIITGFIQAGFRAIIYNEIHNKTNYFTKHQKQHQEKGKSIQNAKKTSNINTTNNNIQQNLSSSPQNSNMDTTGTTNYSGISYNIGCSSSTITTFMDKNNDFEDQTQKTSITTLETSLERQYNTLMDKLVLTLCWLLPDECSRKFAINVPYNNYRDADRRDCFEFPVFPTRTEISSSSFNCSSMSGKNEIDLVPQNNQSQCKTTIRRNNLNSFMTEDSTDYENDSEACRNVENNMSEAAENDSTLEQSMLDGTSISMQCDSECSDAYDRSYTYNNSGTPRITNYNLVNELNGRKDRTTNIKSNISMNSTSSVSDFTDSKRSAIGNSEIEDEETYKTMEKRNINIISKQNGNTVGGREKKNSDATINSNNNNNNNDNNNLTNPSKQKQGKEDIKMEAVKTFVEMTNKIYNTTLLNDINIQSVFIPYSNDKNYKSVPFNIRSLLYNIHISACAIPEIIKIVQLVNIEDVMRLSQDKNNNNNNNKGTSNSEDINSSFILPDGNLNIPLIEANSLFSIKPKVCINTNQYKKFQKMFSNIINLPSCMVKLPGFFLKDFILFEHSQKGQSIYDDIEIDNNSNNNNNTNDITGMMKGRRSSQLSRNPVTSPDVLDEYTEQDLNTEALSGCRNKYDVITKICIETNNLFKPIKRASRIVEMFIDDVYKIQRDMRPSFIRSFVKYVMEEACLLIQLMKDLPSRLKGQQQSALHQEHASEYLDEDEPTSESTVQTPRSSYSTRRGKTTTSPLAQSQQAGFSQKSTIRRNENPVDSDLFYSRYNTGIDISSIDFPYPNQKPKYLTVGDFSFKSKKVDVDEFLKSYLDKTDFMMLRGVAEYITPGFADRSQGVMDVCHNMEMAISRIFAY